jgi:cytochrome c oxidase subunit 2
LAATVALWLVLTGLGELLVWRAPLLPTAAAHEARVSDDAFRLLVRLAVPVFAFVVSTLVVALLRFRSRGAPEGDGPPSWGSPRVVGAWLGVTGLLAMGIMVNPGLVGLAELMGHRGDPDVVVRVEGSMWAWKASYPGSGIEAAPEIVLPVGRLVRFEVTSTDVIHSFWIPAFRMKIDAVPGRVTDVYVTPTRVGEFELDPAFRVQCAELCGFGHAGMRMPVRVVPEEEFRTWLAAGGGKAPTTCEPSGTELRIAAENLRFDTSCLAAPADTPFAIAFENRDQGVPHNTAIYTDETAREPLFVGEIVTGPTEVRYEVPALPAGTYFFRCDVHPTTMTGAFVVS